MRKHQPLALAMAHALAPRAGIITDVVIRGSHRRPMMLDFHYLGIMKSHLFCWRGWHSLAAHQSTRHHICLHFAFVVSPVRHHITPLLRFPHAGLALSFCVRLLQANGVQGQPGTRTLAPVCLATLAL